MKVFISPENELRFCVDLPEAYVLSLNSGDRIVLQPTNSDEPIESYRIYNKIVSFAVYSVPEKMSLALGTTPTVTFFVKK